MRWDSKILVIDLFDNTIDRSLINRIIFEHC